MKIPRSERPGIARRYLANGSDTRASLAAEYGVSERTIERILKAEGAKPGRAIPELTPEQKRRVEILLEDECPLTEIAKTIGADINTLYKYGFRSRSKGYGYMYAKLAPLVRELGL